MITKKIGISSGKAVYWQEEQLFPFQVEDVSKSDERNKYNVRASRNIKLSALFKDQSGRTR